MVDPSTGDALITNGEIYNYRELRNQLRSDGEHFESTGDTAVMLRVLARGGPAAVRRLRGMYAFAFWDVNLRQLTLARDPLASSRCTTSSTRSETATGPCSSLPKCERSWHLGWSGAPG